MTVKFFRLLDIILRHERKRDCNFNAKRFEFSIASIFIINVRCVFTISLVIGFIFHWPSD